ncbi:MAG: Secretion system C-terminal sorting domain [Bacteroidota bacterium]
MKYYLLHILMLFTASFQAQSDLNLQTNYGYYFVDGRAIVETKDYYIAIGRNSKDSLGWVTGLHFSYHNKKNLQVERTFSFDSDTIEYNLQENNFIWCKNDSIIQIIDKGVGDPRTLKILEMNLRTNKIDLVNSIKNQVYVFLSGCLLHENKAYCISTAYIPKVSFAVINEIDKKGNYRNFTFQDSTQNHVYGYALTSYNDSTLLMINKHSKISDLTQESIIISLLNIRDMQVVKRAEIKAPFIIGSISEIIMVNGDTLFLFGSRGKKFPDDHRLKYQPCVFTYSIKNEKTIKMQNFGVEEFNNIDGPYKAVLKSKDGNIVYAVTSYLDFGNNKHGVERGVVGKLDKDNNSIWRRYYTVYPRKEDTLSSFHEIYDLEETTDGHFLVYGEVRGKDENNKWYTNAWIFKIDQDGHLLKEDTINSILEEDKIISIKVYPIPAQDMLYIEQDHSEEVDVIIYDGKGIIVQHIKKIAPSTSFQLDISGYKAGIYYTHIVSDNKKIAQGKFVKI